MEKRMCGYHGCKTLTNVNTFYDMPSMNAYAVKWCAKHAKQYHKNLKVLDEYVPKYNDMKLLDRFGRVIKFNHSTDVSNYLHIHNKKELDRILKTVK